MRLLRFLFSRFFICITVIAALIAAIIFLCVYIHSLLPAATAIALAYIISSAAAISTLVKDEPEAFACAWLAVIIFLPIVGAILYGLYSASSLKTISPTPFPDIAYYDDFEYFDDGGPFLEKLIEFSSSAEKSIYLEFYIIAKGSIWNRLLGSLLSALSRGVEVKIICDGLGSALRAPAKDFKKLKAAGAQIKIFNRIIPAPVSRLNFRDHRKIAAFDEKAVFLGGVNIADEYSHLTAPHGYWKDGGALFFGQIAKVYSSIFLNDFSKASPLAKGEGKYSLLPVTDGPERKGSLCEDTITSAIYSAKERVYIFTPYLCISQKLCDALTFASKRGVAVKIIIPGIPDKKLTYSITRAYCKKLTARGVEVYEYSPGFMHLKGVICDDNALLGSYNLDFRSLYLNRECGVWAGKEIAEKMSADFESCLTQCRKFDRSKHAMPLSLARLIAPLV